MRWSSLAIVAVISLPVTGRAQATGYATLTGVVTDSLRRPIPNAEVFISDLSILGQANDSGLFRIGGIAAGDHRVTIRHIGFVMLDTVFTFAANQTIDRRVTLRRITTLDSVSVKARIDPDMVEFDENRARGFGHFFTRAELEKMEGRTLSSVMAQTFGLEVIRGNFGQAWVTPKHSPMSACGASSSSTTLDCYRRERLLYIPDALEKREGMRMACYSVVMIDRQIVNPERPTSAFDLNSMQVASIEAIEWYEANAQIPPKYNVPQAHCGLLIIHSRRFK